MYRGMPTEYRSDYITGRGILEWEQGRGYTHDGPPNSVTRTFRTHQARTGWIRKIENACQDGWFLNYRIDGMTVTAWMEEVR